MNVNTNEVYLTKGKRIIWHQTQFDGAWVKGQTAGGCGQPRIGQEIFFFSLFNMKSRFELQKISLLTLSI